MPDNSQGLKNRKKMEIPSVEYKLHVEFQRIDEKSNNTSKKNIYFILNGPYVEFDCSFC